MEEYPGTAMATAWHMFQECGSFSWLCLLAGLLASALSVVAIGVALLRARIATLLAAVALGVALLPTAVGVVGRSIDRIKVDGAISGEGIDPEQRERIRVVGYREADSCVAIGGALTAVPLFLAAIALGTAYALRRKPAES
jgi:hypothetical protein